MIMMNSVLTHEERAFLQSIECRDKEQAITVLNSMKMVLPIRSELFYIVVALSEKLTNEYVDFAYEMRAVSGVDDER